MDEIGHLWGGIKRTKVAKRVHHHAKNVKHRFNNEVGKVRSRTKKKSIYNDLF